MARTTFNRPGRTSRSAFTESSLNKRKAVLGSQYRFHEEDEDEDLDLDTEEDAGDEDTGNEDAGGDTEMISVPKAVVDQVKDLLSQIAGDGEDADDGADDDFGDEDFGDEDFDDAGDDEGDDDEGGDDDFEESRKNAYIRKRINEAKAAEARKAIAEARAAKKARTMRESRRVPAARPTPKAPRGRR